MTFITSALLVAALAVDGNAPAGNVKTIGPIEGNATPTVVEAVRKLPDGGTLRFAKGEYHFYEEGTRVKTVMAGANSWGEKKLLFDFEGKTDITIDGGGSTFVWHGNVFPFAFAKCRGVTVGNFTARAFRPSYVEFKIEKYEEDGSFVFRFNDGIAYRVKDGAILIETDLGLFDSREKIISVHALERCSIHYLFAANEKTARDKLPSTFLNGVAEDLGGGRVRIANRRQQLKGCLAKFPFKVGEPLCFLLNGRERCSLFVNECRDVRIHDVWLQNGDGMGIVSFLNENVTIDRYRVEPREGEHVSITADCLFVVNNRGTVDVRNSTFSWALDDAINMHGNYLRVESVKGNELELGPIHASYYNFPPFHPGDTVEFTDPVSHGVLRTARVVSAELRPHCARVVIDGAAPKFAKGTLVEDLTWLPEVNIRDCVFHDVLHVRLSGRGKYVVERNVFRRGIGILISDLSAYWGEAGRTGDMVIRNNEFESFSSRGGNGSFIVCEVEGRGERVPKIHRGIRIEGNRVKGLPKDIPFANLPCARDPIVRDNVICQETQDQDAALPTGGICAHRGDRASYPENTVPAFLSAVSNGAAMVEFDVNRCKTGELIVMHDETIDRTTTGHGHWCDLTFDYLRSVDAGVKFGAEFAGTKIPTFDEAIDCFPKDGVWLNVHCGNDVTDEVARKIKAKGRLHQAFIAAEASGVARARAAVPEIKVCLFSLPSNSWRHAWTPAERRASIADCLSARAEFMQPHDAAFEPDELHAYHAAGGKVNYFWCNKPAKLAQLLARGVDFPLTDNLKPMVEAYRNLRGASCVPSDPERGFGYFPRCEMATGRLAPIGRGYRRADRQFGGIPSVAVSPKNGRLWRTYYAGPTNGEDSNNYVVLSTRMGTNDWQDVLYFDPDGDGPVRSFDPEVWIAPDGKLHWTWTDREVFGLRDGDKNRWASSWSAHGDHLRGVTLDAENLPTAPYPAPRTLVQAGGVMMCKPIAARDGSWLYPVAFWRDDFSARIYRSTDGGKTLVPVGGATLPERNREFDEHNVVELKDGTLRVYMRAKCNGAWNAWQADSHDGGRTWDAAKPCPFPHPNARFFVRRLASGALLLVKNGVLVPPTTPNGAYGNREDMTAYVSDDDGATWQGGLLLHKGQCAYPDGDQAPDGTIHVTFDGDRYQKQEIFHVSFTEADVRRADAATARRISKSALSACGSRTRIASPICKMTNR